MGREIDIELRCAAEEAYVTGEETLAEISRRTGISEGTLERWAAEGRWRGQRGEHRLRAARERRQRRLARAGGEGR